MNDKRIAYLISVLLILIITAIGAVLGGYLIRFEFSVVIIITGIISLFAIISIAIFGERGGEE